MLMLRHYAHAYWQGHHLQPTQHAELAARIAQSDHGHKAQAAQYINLGL